MRTKRSARIRAPKILDWFCQPPPPTLWNPANLLSTLEHSTDRFRGSGCHVKAYLRVWNQLNALALAALDLNAQRRDLGHEAATQATIVFRVAGRGESGLVSRLHTASKKGTRNEESAR